MCTFKVKYLFLLILNIMVIDDDGREQKYVTFTYDVRHTPRKALNIKLCKAMMKMVRRKKSSFVFLYFTRCSKKIPV